MRSGFGVGRELIVEDELVLGRLSTLDGALEPDHGISRRHARVHRAADGGFVVEDESSANGTFVNGERIDGPHPLRTGDEMRIGSTAFLATVPGAPAVVSAPVPQRGKRIAIRLELDFDAGEATIAIDNGPTARIIRDGDGWRVETP